MQMVKKTYHLLIICTIIYILFSYNSEAINYYTSTNGNDTNDGLSTENAIQTIAKVNTLNLQPGDSVLFKRGNTWRFPTDAYLTPKSGDNSGYISYGAYGKGNKPIFLGSYKANNEIDWNNFGNNIWEFNTETDEDVGNIIFNNETSFGVKKKKIINLNSQGDFSYNSTNNKVYLYSTSNPANYYSNIEIAQNKHILRLYYHLAQHHIIFKDLKIKYGSGHGFHGSQISYVIIDNCSFYYIGGSYQLTNESTVRYGNGVEVWDNAHDFIVKNSYFEQCYDEAITNQGTDAEQYNIDYINNIFKDTHLGISIWLDDSGTMHDINISHNTGLNSGGEWSYDERPDKRAEIIGLAETENVEVYNIYVMDNIFYESTEYLLKKFIFFDDSTNVIVGNNLYYQPNPTNTLFKYDEVKYDISEFSDYKTISNYDLNSIIANPQFNNISSNDFRPISSSPACNMSTTGSYVGALPCIGQILPFCGDNTCDNNESCNNCENDCGACPIETFCGDNTCDNNETCNNCENDCGACPIETFCGDSKCDSNENCNNCPKDCGKCKSSSSSGRRSSNSNVDKEIIDEKINKPIDNNNNSNNTINIITSNNSLIINIVNLTKNLDFNKTEIIKNNLVNQSNQTSILKYDYEVVKQNKNITYVQIDSNINKSNNNKIIYKNPKQVQINNTIKFNNQVKKNLITGEIIRIDNNNKINNYISLIFSFIIISSIIIYFLFEKDIEIKNTFLIKKFSNYYQTIKELPSMKSFNYFLNINLFNKNTKQKIIQKNNGLYSELITWINLAKNHGFDDQYIKKILLSRGWTNNIINELLSR
jgi:hypothetical protein